MVVAISIPSSTGGEVAFLNSCNTNGSGATKDKITGSKRTACAKAMINAKKYTLKKIVLCHLLLQKTSFVKPENFVLCKG